MADCINQSQQEGEPDLLEIVCKAYDECVELYGSLDEVCEGLAVVKAGIAGGG